MDPSRQTLAAIRQRVTASVGSWLRDYDCAQIALACAVTDGKELLNFLFNPHTAEAAWALRGKLAVSTEEWATLFGARANRSVSIAVAGELKQDVDRLEAALRCTVGEAGPGSAWARDASKVAAYLAMHLDQHEELVGVTLGGVVRADWRRVEDYRADLEERGLQTLMLSDVVGALAQSVC
tara:strand:+ start:1593 stop:2135 length:543 start_codon:yes stop_codon:yes gene_type:complete